VNGVSASSGRVYSRTLDFVGNYAKQTACKMFGDGSLEEPRSSNAASDILIADVAFELQIVQ
jgi:hypothetical protein